MASSRDELNFQVSSDNQQTDLNNNEHSTSIRTGFFLKSASKYFLQPPDLYRGDLGNFDHVFNNGFTARGTSTDLVKHVYPPDLQDFFKDSGYVSTSTSKEIAASFPKNPPKEGKKYKYLQYKYLYEIYTKEPSINVLEQLPSQLSDKQLKQLFFISEEKERVFLGKINPTAIKGGWKMHIYPELINSNQFVPNPNFIPPEFPEVKLWNAGRGLGSALTGVGFVLDGMSLYHEFQHSKMIGNYQNTYRESARVAGAWTHAWATGAVVAKAGTIVCAPLGPIGQAACGVAGGLAGSAIGYYVGGKAATEIYNASIRDNLSSSIDCEKLNIENEDGLSEEVQSIDEDDSDSDDTPQYEEALVIQEESQREAPVIVQLEVEQVVAPVAQQAQPAPALIQNHEEQDMAAERHRQAAPAQRQPQQASAQNRQMSEQDYRKCKRQELTQLENQIRRQGKPKNAAERKRREVQLKKQRELQREVVFGKREKPSPQQQQAFIKMAQKSASPAKVAQPMKDAINSNAKNKNAKSKVFAQPSPQVRANMQATFDASMDAHRQRMKELTQVALESKPIPISPPICKPVDVQVEIEKHKAYAQEFSKRNEFLTKGSALGSGGPGFFSGSNISRNIGNGSSSNNSAGNGYGNNSGGKGLEITVHPTCKNNPHLCGKSSF